MSGDTVHEIVIIKRVSSGGDHDEHHGGVWKIAFADFMTAMMAFFLVMWLISANDKTKAVIARYFNPVQLVDSTPQPRGLEDPKAGAPSVMPRSGSTPPPTPAKDTKPPAAEPPAKPAASPEAEAAKAAKQDESKVFQDPYALLAELAAKDAAQQPHGTAKAPSDAKVGGTAPIGAKGGEAYRDPFEPTAAPDPRDGTASDLPLPPREAAGAQTLPESKPVPEAAPPSAPEAKLPVSAKAGASAAEPAVSTPTPGNAAAKLRADIQALGKADAMAPGNAPTIEVHQSDEGLLIDVTDGTDFVMFGSASARPSPRTVVLMEKIGRLLKAQTGSIVLRGFTDGRPFKSDVYDNWRLSAARADMAHYMLVRGGVDERRFERIEGYADRRLKDASDIASPANRRIQILVRGAKP